MKLELKLDGECAIEHENSVSLIGVEIYHLIDFLITKSSEFFTSQSYPFSTPQIIQMLVAFKNLNTIGRYLHSSIFFFPAFFLSAPIGKRPSTHILSTEYNGTLRLSFILDSNDNKTINMIDVDCYIDYTNYVICRLKYDKEKKEYIKDNDY